MAASSCEREIRKDFLNAAGLRNIKLSLCNKSVEETRQFLQEKIRNYTIASNKLRFTSLLCLLDELLIFGYRSLHVAFDEYVAKISTVTFRSTKDRQYSRKLFRNTILSKTGLPVVIIDVRDKHYLLLLQRPLDNLNVCRCLDEIIESVTTETCDREIPSVSLCSAAPYLLKLLSTSRDRAIVVFILTSIYSGRTLKSVFGLNEKVVASAQRDTQEFLTIIEEKQTLFDKEAENYLEKKLCELGKSVEAAEATLKRKRHRLDDGEIDNKEFEIANKKKRIDYVKSHMKGVKKRVYRRLFNKWKSTLRSQKRKGQGKYKIDRGAETAIYDVLAEQAKAHSRRLALKVYTF